MTGRPVNIAEFRCRAMKARTAQFSLRDTSRSSNLKVEPLVLVDVSEENPAVFDIGMARDAQRFRRRANMRTVSISQRLKQQAKVIRFNEGEGRAVATLRVAEPWSSPAGPCDLPPAA